MPDRKLTPQEMQRFLYEKTLGKLNFSALAAILDEKTEPSLHDLCINELVAITRGQTQQLINNGSDIARLTKKVEELQERVNRTEAK
jgi:rRNA-processing protein FCF1